MARPQEVINREVPMRPWVECKTDATIVSQASALKSQLTEQIRQSGERIGISDLSLQHIMTLAKNPNATVSYYWNQNKGEWFRYRQSDDVPRWLEAMGKARKDYMWPDGRELTTDMKAKFNFRSAGRDKPKLTSLDD